MVSFQSVSGAGKEKLQEWQAQRELGLPMPLANYGDGVDILEGNVIPYIKGEEEKVRKETVKILGAYNYNSIIPASFTVDCTCVRVPVAIGHLEAVYVETEKPITANDVVKSYERFNEVARSTYSTLPSSPKNFVTLVNKPQPRLHVNLDGGMTAIIGRIEEAQYGIKYIVLSNNLQRGAAKGVVHVAEYLLSK